MATSSVALSENCDEYTDHASSFIHYTAIHPKNENCKIEGSIMSCQTHDFEQPDDITSSNIRDNVSTRANNLPQCFGLNFDEFQVEAKPVILGALTTELSGETLAQRHYASNCADGFNLSKITTHNYYTCRNFGDITTDDGKTIRNYHKTWDGVLPSCEDNLELSKQTEEDIKKIVQHRNKVNGWSMKLSDIACNIYGSSL